MLAAQAHILAGAAQEDLIALLDHTAVDHAGVADGLAAAPAHGFDFLNGIRPRHQPGAALKEVAGIQSGSAQPNRQKVASVTIEQVEAIAKDKMTDMNCFTLESAIRMVAGTARSMGITVVGEVPAK